MVTNIALSDIPALVKILRKYGFDGQAIHTLENDARLQTLKPKEVLATMGEDDCNVKLSRPNAEASKMLKTIGFTQVEQGNYELWGINLGANDYKDFDITPAYLKRELKQMGVELGNWTIKLA